MYNTLIAFLYCFNGNFFPFLVRFAFKNINAGDLVSIPRKIPRRREWLPTPVFLPGEIHRQRSLVGYSPWGHKELDTTERLSITQHSTASN